MGHESNSYLSRIWEIMSQQVYGETWMDQKSMQKILKADVWWGLKNSQAFW